MATTTGTYAERMTAVHEEVAELLAAQTDEEVRVVQWMRTGPFDLSTLESLRDMVRRAKRSAWDDGYHRGVMDEFKGTPEVSSNPYTEPED